MNIQLLKTISNPSSQSNHSHAIWVSEQDASYWLTDQWKVFRLRSDSDYAWQPIYEAASQEEAYSMKNVYDRRLPDFLNDEIKEKGIQGFKLLSPSEYESVKELTAGSSALLEIINRSSMSLIGSNVPVRSHCKTLIAFGDKTIMLCSLDSGASISIASTKTKGKAPLQACLHPSENLIVYGTNYGEIFGQPFTDDGFGKSFKINTPMGSCYQLTFTKDGSTLIAACMGYLKIFARDKATYKEVSFVQTAVRSFELINDKHLILNKGIHGIEWYCLEDQTLCKLGSLELPFAVDRLTLLAGQTQILASSNPEGHFGILKYTY